MLQSLSTRRGSQVARVGGGAMGRSSRGAMSSSQTLALRVGGEGVIRAVGVAVAGEGVVP